MNKAAALEELKREIAADKSLPLIESNLVFGEGDPNAEVIFIGEAPGFYENQQGRPFVGRAGQLLDELLKEIDWKRSSVYITNIVKRRPPENRDPLPEEVTAYYPYLKKQIDIINPKLIVPLGRFSMNIFLPDAKISRDQGRVFRKGDWIIFPLYHPAAALRSTAVLEELRKKFGTLPTVRRKLADLLAEKPAELTAADKHLKQEKLF
ncbi:MAG: uracil-DNA glycosylase [Patescibacteria group bacterium]|nr:uracil-DNA glycosylase [Patescibacteria group bacterium]MCL5224065.1 uracil-DNA glycosylase [Patescibacteria group bacterium]